MTIDEYCRALLDYSAALDAILFHPAPDSQGGMISRSQSFDALHRFAQLCVIYHQRPSLSQRHATAAQVGLRVRRYQDYDCLEPIDGFPQLAP